jgi:hypothetical protein
MGFGFGFGFAFGFGFGMGFALGLELGLKLDPLDAPEHHQGHSPVAPYEHRDHGRDEHHHRLRSCDHAELCSQ